MDDIKYLIALHALAGMGSKRLKILIDYFQNHGMLGKETTCG